MKNFIKMFGIIAIVGLLFAACGGDDKDLVSGLGGISGNNQKVFLMGENAQGAPRLTDFTGNIPAEQFVTVPYLTRSVANGNLTFTLSVPGDGLLASISTIKPQLDEFYNAVTFSDSSARIIEVSGFSLLDGRTLRRGNVVFSGTWPTIAGPTSGTLTQEFLRYIYVDKDVTISGTGKSGTLGGTPFTSSSINLSLKKGWNIVNDRAVYTITGLSTATLAISHTMSNPASHRWILFPVD
jgi:hypothetical protein